MSAARKFFVALVVPLGLVVTSLPGGSARAAAAELRQCTNAECAKYALSETWTFCPYCGTELPAVKDESGDDETEEEILGNVYRNRALGFQIEKPSQKWTFVTKGSGLRQINPVATVAMQSESGPFALVIVERVPGVDLEKYARLVAPRVQNRTKVSQEEVKLNGRDALRFKYSGDAAQGLTFHHYQTLLESGGRKYQILCGCIAGQDGKEMRAYVQAIEESFRLLDDEGTGPEQEK